MGLVTSFPAGAARVPTATPLSAQGNVIWPVTVSTNLLRNWNFGRDAFGLIRNWAQTNIDSQR